MGEEAETRYEKHPVGWNGTKTLQKIACQLQSRTGKRATPIGWNIQEAETKDETEPPEYQKRPKSLEDEEEQEFVRSRHLLD